MGSDRHLEDRDSFVFNPSMSLDANITRCLLFYKLPTVPLIRELKDKFIKEYNYGGRHLGEPITNETLIELFDETVVTFCEHEEFKNKLKKVLDEDNGS
jgi:hypothetical protein